MQKYRNRILLGFAIGFVVYVVYLLVAPTEELFRNLLAFPLWLLLPLVALQFVAFFFRWLEWHYYLGVIGAARKLGWQDSMVTQFAGFTLAVSPGKAAELLKAVVVKTKTGVPVARVAPVVIAERVVDGMAVIILMVLALLLGGDASNLTPQARFTVFASGAVLVTGLIVVQIAPLAYFCINLTRHVPLVRRAHGPLTQFYESSREIFQLRHVLPMLAVGTVVYGTSAFTLMFALMGFGITPTWDTFVQGALISGVGAAVGAVSAVPNGAGVTEGSTAGLLIIMMGVEPGVAATVGIIHGFFNKWFRVFFGMMVALVFRKRLFTDDLNAELASAEATAHAPRETAPAA